MASDSRLRPSRIAGTEQCRRRICSRTRLSTNRCEICPSMLLFSHEVVKTMDLQDVPIRVLLLRIRLPCSASDRKGMPGAAVLSSETTLRIAVAGSLRNLGVAFCPQEGHDLGVVVPGNLPGRSRIPVSERLNGRRFLPGGLYGPHGK